MSLRWRPIVPVARVRRRLGHHHDHRRVGATGMVGLMGPGGRPSLAQVSSCQCIMVAVGRHWSGRAPVCFPRNPSRTCHWPCQWRVLVVCYYHKRQVTGPRGSSVRTREAQNGAGLFSFCRLRRGLSFFFVVYRASSCRAHGALQTRRTPGCRLLPKLIPVLWPLCAVAR